MFDRVFLAEALPALIPATGTTLAISAAGVGLGLLFGIPVAVGGMSLSPAARWGARVYVSFFRGVPLLVQLLLAYYALPFIGLDIPALGAAVGTLGLCCAAYMGEILRGGLTLVPKGGVEAARLLGLTERQILFRIRLPIALAAMRPSIISETIMIVKASSLVSVVGILELTRSAQAIASSTFQPLEAYALAGAVYLTINGIIAAVGAVRAG